MDEKDDAVQRSAALFRKTGLIFTCFFATVLLFAVSTLLFSGRYNPNFPTLLTNTVILAHACAGFILASLYPRFHSLQPIILLILTPLAMTIPGYALLSPGFFISAEILFHRLGYFEQQRIPKILINIFYFYLCQILVGVTTGLHFAFIFISLLATSLFILFLIITFGNSWVIYLSDPKPKLSLASLNLTRMEIVYLRFLLAGKSIKAIAIESGVKESTVRNTLSRVYRKFDVADKAGLIAKCDRFLLTD